MPPLLIIPCDELRRLYEAGQSTQTLAQRYQCSPTTITNHLRRCGIAVRPSCFAPKPVPQAELRRLYHEARWPVGRIAAHFGVSVSSITNARRRYGIAARAGRRSPGGDSAEEGGLPADEERGE